MLRNSIASARTLSVQITRKTHVIMAAPSHETSAKAAFAAVVAGTVAADAATFGAHWEYDVANIQKVAASLPSEDGIFFCDPIARWHKDSKKGGDVSMYGEVALLAAETLKAKDGWSSSDFGSRYYKTFGPCGSYHGYADHTTKLCVYSHFKARMEREKDTFPPMNLPASDLALKEAVHGGMPGLAERYSGQELLDHAVALAKQACPGASAEGMAWVTRCAQAYDAIYAACHGADDNQSNGNGKLVVVAARYAGAEPAVFTSMVERAVRATQNNEEAVSWSMPVAHFIAELVHGKPLDKALEAIVGHFQRLNPSGAEKVKKALTMAEEDVEEGSGSKGLPKQEMVNKVIKELGPSCFMASTVPGSLYILSCVARAGLSSESYVQAVKMNLMAGGENCGRATIIGGALAAATVRAGVAGPDAKYGVPVPWVEQRLASKPRSALLAALA